MVEIFSKDDYEVNIELPTKECKLCGKLFNVGTRRNASRIKYCPRSHYSFCEICGNRFELSQVQIRTNPIKTTCSQKCLQLKVIKTAAASAGVSAEGLTNISQIAEIKSKMSASIKAKSSETSKKVHATMIERYGAATPMQVPELRAKIDATNLEKYGNTNPAKNVEVRKKISERAGSKEVREKYKATSRQHYGVDYPAQSDEIQYMMRKTCFEHYGVEYPHQIKEISDKAIKTCLERYSVPAAFLRPEAQQKARQTILSNLTDKFTRVSKLNQSIADKFNQAGIETEFEFYLAGKWYDLHVLNTNVIIEINPSYTHSQVPSHWMKEGLDNNYHLMKSAIAKENGYRCIHVFDWDDMDKIISIIRPTKKIYARKCEIQEIDKNLAKTFLDDFHLQGSTYGVQIALGLYYNYQLVEVMTFGKPRYNKNYQWELLRLCTLPEYSVIGGASKLFKYFINKKHPRSVLSYCDAAKFTGHVYEQLGMKLHHTSDPAKIWSKGTDYITDNLLRQRGFDQLFGTNYGKGSSNEELMIEHRWLPIYDCGQYVYVYEQN